MVQAGMARAPCMRAHGKTCYIRLVHKVYYGAGYCHSVIIKLSLLVRFIIVAVPYLAGWPADPGPAVHSGRSEAEMLRGNVISSLSTCRTCADLKF
jgi:hypothetical protein